ncbi:MAG: flagellar hook protein FlgE [Azonexus sp.]|jgi:flagellar hook protein FlgE|uniref:flagellar hook protein FlgE n=1 Tax=Azonexus sp. TaxID=1872668 RepID=UPI00283475A9|nr:flagellar hook protein FlgE [Azonexus sp.]MDR0777745.1 flagellar hook protein FlgE [Azonexus sp.]
MAFQQALSGLNTSSKAIDATSHNIANSSTVGFKAGVAHFADVYAASLTGNGASQIGIGANLVAIQQQFTQGNITTTNNPLDIAINGGGFFRMDHNGAVSYTRNGQFHLDKSGYVINDQGLVLTGYAMQNGTLTQTIVPLQISASYLTPQATGSNVNSPFNGIRVNLNLDSRVTEPTSAWVDGGAPGDTNNFTPDPTTYNFATGTTIYDSLGNPHSMMFYFRKTAAGNEWDVYATLDGTTNQNITPGGGPIGTLAFDPLGQISGGNPMNVTLDILNTMISQGQPGGNGALPTQTFPIDFTGTTQFGSNFSPNRIEQDGYAAGSLVGVSVAEDGIIQARYSNGQTYAMGQVVLVDFTNPNGLRSIGNNQWIETSDSGAPMVGAPNTSGRGVLASYSVEESNVDLTAELVNLITNQRNYQANAQSIKTQDQIMQTLVNLR